MLQHAIVGLKCEHGINEVELLFRSDWKLRRLARDPVTGDEYLVPQKGGQGGLA